KKTQAGRVKRSWHVFRGKVLSYLQRGKRIKTNFIARVKFFGEVKNPQKQKQYQQEFIQNTINSDYVVSIRGTANTSFRLYEVLSFGRIPVFINTDCVLPYEWEIDWKNICVWVDESEVDQIEQKIIDFHNRLSPEEFINLQKKCRQVWEEYLSPEGFFRHFHQHFEEDFAPF
ncbi:MAG: exostosin family protein, partial [Anaerolineae bacterium]|nr:exostosin family protein [Anaerolineae bacterium]